MCPAGQARYARGGHFVACLLGGMGSSSGMGRSVGRHERCLPTNGGIHANFWEKNAGTGYASLTWVYP